MGLALIIIIILAVVAISWLRRHPDVVARWVARRMVKQFTAGQEKKRRPRQQRGGTQRRTRSARSAGKGHVIPPEYAEDIAFTEIKAYSDSHSTVDSNNGTTEYNESQVSDVEWEEIKIRRK